MDGNAKAVREFMVCIALGFAVFIPVCCIIFALAGKFSLSVLWGCLYGAAVMLIYYFLFARAISNAADADPDTVKKRIQAAYSLRMLLLVILMGAGVLLAVKLSVFHWLPLIASILVPRISIAVWQILNRKNQKKDGDGSGN